MKLEGTRDLHPEVNFANQISTDSCQENDNGSWSLCATKRNILWLINEKRDPEEWF